MTIVIYGVEISHIEVRGFEIGRYIILSTSGSNVDS